MNNPNFANRSEAKIPSWRDCQLKTANLLSPLHSALCLFLIFNFSFLIEAQATIRYVSQTGTSTPPYTTWETAADSIQKAIDICLPGDTVMVANGVYYENLVIDSMLTLIGSSMDSTIIDGRGMGDFTILNNEPLSIKNFNIYGKGNNVGIVIWSIGSAFPVIEVRNCNISETGVGIACWGLIADKIIMKNLRSGFNIAGNPGSDNYISNCVMILDMQDSYGISLPGPSDANYYITNNIILFTGTNSLNHGIAIGAPRRVYIYNNLISGFGRSINFDTVIDTAFVKYNILAYGGSLHSSGNRIYVNNTILTKNGRSIFQQGSGFISSDYNLFWGNGLDVDGTTYGDSDKVANPMFVKDTLPNSDLDFDYHLQAYSPGINRGDPNILDVDSSRSDIGLYGGPFGESYTYQDFAPRQPVNLSAVQDTNHILLKWNRNSEADTSHYNIYRDTIPNFVTDSTKLIGSPVDTFFIQYPPYVSSQYVYKVTCVDNQGNESVPSEEIVIKPVSVSEYPLIINNYYLYQNYPNPFNPSTIISYKLKERGYVKLMVYDIKGEMISVLVNKQQEAGYYEVEFDVKSQKSKVKSSLASGIYLYRIEVIGEGRIPVYSDMRKMILVK